MESTNPLLRWAWPLLASLAGAITALSFRPYRNAEQPNGHSDAEPALRGEAARPVTHAVQHHAVAVQAIVAGPHTAVPSF